MKSPASEPDSAATAAVDADLQRRERYRERLEELRTVLPGVQVLLAFLLTAPFGTRFSELSSLGRATYGAAVFFAAIATVLLLAPTSHHRLTRAFGQRNMGGGHLHFATRATLAGIAALAISMIAALWVVLDFVFDLTIAVALSGTTAAVVIVIWYVVPLRSRSRSHGSEEDP